MASSLDNDITIAIIRFRVNRILKNEIKSRLAKNEDVNDLINVLNHVKTDDYFLMQLVNICNVDKSIMNHKDIKTNAAINIDNTSIGDSSTANTDVTNAGTSSTANTDVINASISSTANIQ